MSDTPPSFFATPAPAERPAGKRRFLLAALLLVSLAGLGAFAFLIYYRSQQVLTPAKLEAARKRWEKANIQSYDLDITVSGRTQATYHLQVRGGAIAAATQNGKPFDDEQGKLDEQRARHWTVAGLFDILETELANAAKPDAPPCYSQVEFDDSFGYPRRFLRSAGGHTTAIDVQLTPRS